jgi:metal-dependent HD superfamily phosphatase/phosphodiesterase
MERNEINAILNGMCERCLIKGMISTIDEANELCDVFDRFLNNGYTNDVEYSNDVMYLYNLGVKLHESGNTSLEESYSIYSALLAADSIDFIEIKDFVEDVVKSNIDDGVVDITDIDS